MKKELVLVHGWDPQKYSKFCKNAISAWDQRTRLIKEIEKYYTVHYFNLPGFCGTPEPNARVWDVEDFARAFNDWIIERKLNPEIVLGYSFGGAIALLWKLVFVSETPIVLVSPAITRRETKKSRIGRIGERLFGKTNSVGKLLKHCYLYLFNKYYRLGTPFLRNTYDRIVRRDLRDELIKVPPDQVLLVYGERDTATPWTDVKDIALNGNFPHVVIPNGTHAIGETHPREIMDAIADFRRLK
jgi:pimeloyl-ACP methyl ester carboxylesterase